MKTQRTWPYLSLVALMGLAGCSTSRQTAQNTGEMDDLYASSSNAAVYEGSREPEQLTQRTESPRVTTRQRERTSRNTNPDYATYDEQRGYDPNAEEYYTELSTRNIKRGLSADPGWNRSDASGGGYNDGFTDGYYAGIGNPSYNSARWNPWGWNNGFNSGFSMGIGLGSAFGSPWGWNSWNRFGGGFYDPFWGGGFNTYAYNPWGYGGGFYDPFWGGGFNRYGGYYGGGFNSWGGYGGYGRPIIVNNTIVTGADPYRSNRTVGARGGTASTNRYNGDFNNTPRNTGNPGGRQAYGNNRSAPAYSDNAGSSNTGSTNTNSSDEYYARPRQNSRGSYYYENGGSAPSGNSSRTGTPAPNSTYSNNPGNSNNGNGGYYSAPRQNNRGTYSAPSDNGGGYNNRSSQPSYQAPQQQRSTYESRPQSQPTYSAPSSDGGSRGGGSYSAPSSSGSSSGGGGGGSRGPR